MGHGEVKHTYQQHQISGSISFGVTIDRSTYNMKGKISTPDFVGECPLTWNRNGYAQEVSEKLREGRSSCYQIVLSNFPAIQRRSVIRDIHTVPRTKQINRKNWVCKSSEDWRGRSTHRRQTGSCLRTTAYQLNGNNGIVPLFVFPVQEQNQKNAKLFGGDGELLPNTHEQRNIPGRRER